MHYYLYEIKNNLNGKIYVGVHKTVTLDDGYMGSGMIIKRAIAKSGLENFTKVILETFDDPVSMYAREKEVVTEEFLARGDVYNLRRGGHGGFDHVNKSLSLSQRQLGGSNSDVVKRRDKVGQYSEGFVSPFKNKSVQVELSRRAALPASVTKRKATFAERCHAQGSKNSQYGLMWITNGAINSKIQKNSDIPDGWNKGRKMGLPDGQGKALAMLCLGIVTPQVHQFK